MIEQNAVTHHIQKYIIGVLIHQKYARFRDLRPPKTDTNLFSYHLKALVRAHWINKTDAGYTLSRDGLAYVDRVSLAKLTVRSQPKIISMLLIQNSDGDILLQKRTKQPYIDTWTLPYGKTHIDDVSVEAAAGREAHEKLGLGELPLRHVGDCYIRVTMSGSILSTTLAHIFRSETDDIQSSDTLQWVAPRKLAQQSLAPAVEQVIARAFFGDDYFFAEFTEEWAKD